MPIEFGGVTMAQAKRKFEKVSTEGDMIDFIVDEAIEAAGGDMRAAIMGLIRGQHTYQAEIDRTVSAGYVRRGPRS